MEDAARETGLPADAIVELARTIAAHSPALAIASDEQPAVAALNLVLGGGVVQRRETVVPSTPAAASPRAVLIDASVPWDYEVAIRRRNLPLRRLGRRRIEQPIGCFPRPDFWKS